MTSQEKKPAQLYSETNPESDRPNLAVDAKTLEGFKSLQGAYPNLHPESQ